ncbi:uncharacterized protein LOC136089189 isoform X2 [Hydra vulgaris]|uniref:Uncharacterized protein LOC136089189 isoform X2 n=1 Tax=Hydra vulgaris TaxID=6087 RepID=A0ABM4D9E6_HYDVU
MMKKSSISHDTRKHLNDNKTNIKERSIESSGDSDISKESFVSFKVKKKWSSCRDEQSNDSSSSSPKIKKIAPSKCNSEKQNQMIKNSSVSLEDTRKNLNDDKTNKKDVILNPNYKYCPTCGSAAKDAPASKANLESARRSIKYRIREEAKITRTLFSLNNNTVNIQIIITEQTINKLPFNQIESFHDFDNQLKKMLHDVKCQKYFKTFGKFIFCSSKDYFTEYSSALQCLWARVKWCKKIEFFWHRNLQIFARSNSNKIS